MKLDGHEQAKIDAKKKLEEALASGNLEKIVHREAVIASIDIMTRISEHHFKAAQKDNLEGVVDVAMALCNLASNMIVSHAMTMANGDYAKGIVITATMISQIRTMTQTALKQIVSGQSSMYTTDINKETGETMPFDFRTMMNPGA